MGRLKDAWQVLVGRDEYAIRSAAKLARIEAEWLEICSSLERVLPNLTSIEQRLRKAEERARKREREAPALPSDVAMSVPRFGRHTSPLKMRKAELRRARQATGTEGGAQAPPAAPRAGETVVEEETP